MTRWICLATAMALLAACGIEGPPSRPDPEPEPEETSRSTITFSADGYVGAVGRF